jgi:hypothetical protein
MLINARAKGQNGERSVIKELDPVVNKVYSSFGLQPPSLQRNTLQSDAGGFDIVFSRPDGSISHDLDWLAIEVKNCKTLCVAKWWEQTVKQSKGREPVLIYKIARGRWAVIVDNATLNVSPLCGIKVKVEVDMETFLAYLELRLTEQLLKRKEVTL